MKTIMVVIWLLNGSPTGQVDVVDVPGDDYDACTRMVDEMYRRPQEPPKSFLAGCIRYSTGRPA